LFDTKRGVSMSPETPRFVLIAGCLTIETFPKHLPDKIETGNKRSFISMQGKHVLILLTKIK
jgi:hypothetical protein